MSGKREPVTPTLDVPMDVAAEELTGFEVIAVQKHFRADLGDLGGARTMIAVVWCYENRVKPTPWSDVENMTLRELAGYFAEPSKEPEDEVGKESPHDD